MDAVFRPEFTGCWAYPGLRELKPSGALLHLVSFPNPRMMASWTVFGQSEDHCVVRRIHGPSPELIGGHQHLFGADAQMALSDVRDIAGGAEALVADSR